MTEVISRQDAKAAGLKRYFLGTPCKNGHVAERFVSDCKCVVCKNDRLKEKYANDPEWRAYRSEYYAQWRDENPEQALANSRDWYANNKERALETQNAWAKNNREAK